jgi:XisH protein
LYQAIGQFILYRKALRKADPDRLLFLAIDIVAFKQIFDDPEGESLRAEEGINLLVFDKHTEDVILWKT